MPLTYDIDHSQRTVFARATGVLTPQDLFAYQEQVWLRPEVRGYHECIDMSGVTEIVDATDRNMKALAQLAVQADDPAQPTRLAIIARQDLHFGLGRMYESYRSMQPKHTRQVSVFRSKEDALRWLTQEETAP
jgi:hypothetical protein